MPKAGCLYGSHLGKAVYNCRRWMHALATLKCSRVCQGTRSCLQRAFCWLLTSMLCAVQSSTNTLLSHTISLLINLWLIRLVGKNVATQPAGYIAKPAM